jgi:hypothetical protein
VPRRLQYRRPLTVKFVQLLATAFPEAHTCNSPGSESSSDDNDRLTPFDGVVNDEIGSDFTVVLQRVSR